jgi:hypothetical protein
MAFNEPRCARRSTACQVVLGDSQRRAVRKCEAGGDEMGAGEGEGGATQVVRDG